MKATVMQQQTANATRPRPVTALLRAFEKLAVRDMREKLASGVFRLVDEFNGIDRLDRAELDETDEDVIPTR
jgi:hypothetical protein